MRLIGRYSFWTQSKQVVTGIRWLALSRKGHVKFCTCTTSRRSAESVAPPWRIMFFGTDEFSLAHLKVLHKSMQDENQTLVKKLEVTVTGEKVSNNLLNPFWVDSIISYFTVITFRGRSTTSLWPPGNLVSLMISDRLILGSDLLVYGRKICVR